MAYIGQSIKNGTFKDLGFTGTFNSSTTDFNLGTQIGSAAQILVSKNGVIQRPGTDFTLASGGSQISFTTAPASADSIFIVEISGAVGGPMNRDINGDELILDVDGDTSITADTDDQIDIKIAGADDFKFSANAMNVLSGSTLTIDSGATLTVSGSTNLSNTPNFSAYLGSNQTVANATATKLLYNTEEFDSGGCYDASNSKFVVPSGEGGKYLFTAQFEIDTIDSGERVELKVYKNNSEDNRARQFQYTGSDGKEHFIHNSFLLNLSASDYIEIYTQHNVGQNRTYYASHTRFSGFKLIE
jgi:hypothetical protein